MKLKIMLVLGALVCLALLCLSYFGLGSSTDKVIIATNADEEAIAIMKESLNQHGYKGQYIIQPQGTSELGGKIMAEGSNIEADIITEASYYLKSAQDQNHMFVPMKNKTQHNTIDKYPNYIIPLLGNTGSLFINKKALEKHHLEVPHSIKDLTKPEYKGQVSMPNVMESSTGWLVLQGILNEYGEKEGQDVIKKLLINVGPHLEDGGSGPLQKVESGEVAVGVGLRAQAIEQEKGNIIKHIDPKEGNFSLVEGAAVVKKGGEKQKKAEKMVEVIQKYGRKDLMKQYPVTLYKGEHIAKDQKPEYPKKWKDPLTVDLLQKHQDIFNAAKKEAENEK
ncbi:extracellular solute-binding protein [Staphylococcus sp. GDY8P57P]|uniref:extracellular solute-binding protein n=1 Tax=Staphylococcus sp. GDY8P57P TaxID=2804128 RepID=UPI001E2EE19D|nr:extracellular solute-binding protein [Staphylococcus sp. GDY8P57P]